MHDDEDSKFSDSPTGEETVSPTSEGDDAGDGLEVGGQIAEIMSDLENDLSGQQAGDDDDPGTGLGTGGEVKAPSN